MSDAPKTIWAWYFADPDQNEHMQGGWTDKPDKRETEYTRADLAEALAAALRGMVLNAIAACEDDYTVKMTAEEWNAHCAATDAATAALAAWEARK